MPADAAVIAESIRHGALWGLLPDALQQQVAGFSEQEVLESCRHVLVRPHPLEVPVAGMALLNPALAGSWLAVFADLGLPRELAVYEPCAGSSEPIALATEVYSGGQGRYVTLNLNQRLAAELRPKLARLRGDWQIIDDYAQLAGQHLAPGSFDVACFHHAVNDLVQTAVAEPRGMDTRSLEWWSHERQMIEWLAEEFEAGELALRARPALVAAVAQAATLVRPGGWLIFDHWTWERYRQVDWFPFGLFTELIPLARGWIAAAGLPLREATPASLDPQWWMAWQRTA
ncbi:MAG: hypothetical protein IT204_13445 [Fimbriimonadaceae bacterium]|nr:hypothetical protein [Fimbriimonadaceae bacterium]